MTAHSRFRRQHHGIGALIDRRRDIRRFGTRGRGILNHRFQHLRCHDDRPALGTRAAYDAALDDRNLLRREFHAQVAARDHDGVVDVAYHTVFDELDRIIGESYDQDTDGIMDWEYRYTYDQWDHIDSQGYDSDGNGFYNQFSQSIWDAQDRQLAFENDHTGDGVADYIMALTLDCE